MATYLLIGFVVILAAAELITLGVLVLLLRQPGRPAHRRSAEEQRLQRLLDVARAGNARV